jgi:mannose-1-phosphate guanylyltransferase
MLPVGHRPIVENLVSMLAPAGVDEVVLALGFKPQPFVDAFPDGICAGVRLVYAVEPQPLDTAGAIRFAADFAGVDDTFVVVNGDVLTDVDVARLVEFHRSRAAEATLHLTPVDDPSSYGVVALADDGRVERFVEKPAPGAAPSNLINAGTYVLEASVLGRIAPGRKVSIERETFPTMVAEGRVFGMATDDYWVDTGRPDPYRQANLDLLDGRRRLLTAVAVEDGAVLGDGVSIQHSLVSRGASVGTGAMVVDSVILPGATVGAGARIESSIVMGRVGSSASVVHSVIGAEGVVADGERIVEALVPDPATV